MSWAIEMARTGRLSHGDFADRITHAMAAEDIAEGQQSINQVITVWMNSPPHRANILGQFNIIGVGFAKSADNQIYWCVDFAWTT